MPMSKGMRPLISSIAKKMEENRSTSEHVLRLSGYYNCLNQVGVNIPNKIIIDKVL